MSGGDLPCYLKENPEADRLGLVGVPSVVLIPRSLMVPVIRCRQRPLPPPFLQRDPWGPQGGMRFFYFSFYHHVNTRPAKRPCGPLW